MLGMLPKKESFQVLFTKKLQAAIPSSANFAGVVCTKDVVVSEIN